MLTERKLFKDVDFDVKLEPAKVNSNGWTMEVPSFFVPVRQDTNEPMGAVVGKAYKLHNHKDSLRQINRLLGAISSDYTVEHKFHGARIFSEFTLNDVALMPGNRKEFSKLVARQVNSYDGKSSVLNVINFLRVFCTNMQMVGQQLMAVKISHVLAAGQRIAAMELTDQVNRYKAFYREAYKILSQSEPKDWEELRIPGFSKKTVRLAMENFEQEGDDSAWGQYNAFTSYITHSPLNEPAKQVHHAALNGFLLSNYALPAIQGT